MSERTILLVDDDVELRAMLSKYLKAEGFDVMAVSDGETALDRFEAVDPDLTILDVGLPGLDGFEVLSRIRRTSDAYVIMLTARAEELDKVLGLTMGADDYLTKPFSPRELVARIRAALRRQPTDNTARTRSLDFGNLHIDVDGRSISVDGGEVVLTALEFDLLTTLASNPGRVFSRRNLLERVWGYDYFGTERVVDVHVANIRRALGDDSTQPRFISTVRGVGYKFVGGGS